jgi:ATP diphosphatase
VAGEAEFGDLLFALVALGRQLGLQAEDALRAATLRFEERVRAFEGDPAK